MSTEQQAFGPRNVVRVLNEIAELCEKNPGIDRPSYFYASNSGDIIVTFQLDQDYDWKKSKEEKREDLETRIERIIRVLDVPLEANEPSESYEGMYYSLKGIWHGAKVEIKTYRANVCEKVVVSTYEEEIELPDPELTKDIPKVKQKVTKEITEWMCNEKLGEVRAEMFLAGANA